MSAAPTDLKPGESIARCFFFACDGCGWRSEFWSYQCLECGHWGCSRTDLPPVVHPDPGMTSHGAGIPPQHRATEPTGAVTRSSVTGVLSAP